MKHFLKIADGIDVGPLKSQIEARPELWDAHTIRRTAPGTPHSDVSDIWVRYNDVAEFEQTGDFTRFNDEHVPIFYPAWRALPALRPIVFGLMAQVEGEMLGGVLITRIPAGKGIAAHRDFGWHVEQYDKFYLSIQSDFGADFLCDHDGATERLNPQAGDIWLFDNRKLHWVENRSTKDRITAIICIRTERYSRTSGDALNHGPGS